MNGWMIIVSCELIAHKKGVCLAPQNLDPPEKYDIPLRTTTFSNPRLVTMVQQEDLDSGLSSVASVGNSSYSIEPSQNDASSCKNQAQLVPHVASKQASLSPHVVSYQTSMVPHMDSHQVASLTLAINRVPLLQVEKPIPLLGSSSFTL
jgi:hypothetical protein